VLPPQTCTPTELGSQQRGASTSCHNIVRLLSSAVKYNPSRSGFHATKPTAPLHVSATYRRCSESSTERRRIPPVASPSPRPTSHHPGPTYNTYNSLSTSIQRKVSCRWFPQASTQPFIYSRKPSRAHAFKQATKRLSTRTASASASASGRIYSIDSESSPVPSCGVQSSAGNPLRSSSQMNERTNERTKANARTKANERTNERTMTVKRRKFDSAAVPPRTSRAHCQLPLLSPQSSFSRLQSRSERTQRTNTERTPNEQLPQVRRGIYIRHYTVPPQ